MAVVVMEAAENWEAVQQQIQAKTPTLLQEMMSLEDNYEGWEDLGTIKEIEGTRLMTESGLYVVRAKGIIPASPEAIFALVSDLDRKKQWDPMFVEGRVVKEFSPEVKVNYQRFYAPWPVSHRDFVFMSVLRREPDGTIVFAGSSIDIPSLPDVSGLVRGEMVRGGFILRPHGEGETRVTYIVHVDPRGMLPTMIVNKFQKSQTANVYKIKKIFLQPA